jgi:NitT/TauT family transport system ATP-binding protein
VYLADRVVIMAARPGRVKEILDIKSVREADHWDSHPRIEDVMDLESFVRLRTRIWKSLREEHAGVEH